MLRFRKCDTSQKRYPLKKSSKNTHLGYTIVQFNKFSLEKTHTQYDKHVCKTTMKLFNLDVFATTNLVQEPGCYAIQLQVFNHHQSQSRSNNGGQDQSPAEPGPEAGANNVFV